MNMVSTDYLSKKYFFRQIKSNSKQKKYKVNILSISEIGIRTGNDQWKREKSTKTSSTGKVKY